MSPKPRRTVIVALNPGCRYCALSADFYKKLESKIAEASDISLVLAIDVGVPFADGSAYVKSLGLSGSPISLDFRGVGIGATPTLAVLDRNRRVTHRWIGRLDDNKEAEVLEILI